MVTQLYSQFDKYPCGGSTISLRQQIITSQIYPLQLNEPTLFLTLDKMAAISQTIFSDAFSGMKSFLFWILKNYWTLFLGVQLTINRHWFR